MLDGRRGIDFRRRWSIVAYVGPNGSGKTLAAMTDTLESIRNGRRVLSTVRILDWENPRPCDDDDCPFPGHPDHGAAHPQWLPFRGWDDLLNAEACDVLMDEVTGVASARESMGLPAPVANMLVQLRRRDLVLRWTSPAWARADRIIRECTQVVAMCKGSMPRAAAGREWRTNTLFSVRVLDARELDEVTAGSGARLQAMNRSWARLHKLPARNAYDTMDSVLALPVVEGGRCASCGGRRSVPSCSCSDAPPRRRGGPLGGAPSGGASAEPRRALRVLPS